MSRDDPTRSIEWPKVVFWAAIIFAFAAAIMPRPPEIPGAPNDKVQHVIAFLTLAALGLWAYPRTQKTVLLIGLAAFGALIEIVQAIPALHRDSDPEDWMADTLAAAAVLSLIAFWRLARGRGATRPPARRA